MLREYNTVYSKRKSKIASARPYLHSAFTLLLLTTLSCQTWRHLWNPLPLPEKAGILVPGDNRRQTPEYWQGYPIHQLNGRSYSDSELENTEITMQLVKFTSDEKALAAFLAARLADRSTQGDAFSRNLRTLRLERAGWASANAKSGRAAFWQGKFALAATASQPLTAEQWESRLKGASKLLPKGAPRPLAFALLLREESNIRLAKYAQEDPVPQSNDLKEFFYAPWKSSRGAGHFAFRTFRDRREAENFFYRLTRPTPSATALLTEWFSRRRKKSYKVVIRKGEKDSQYFFWHEQRIFCFTGGYSESGAQKEIDLIWEGWTL